ncbi:MAG: VOC family protein [Brachymonas sp.]
MTPDYVIRSFKPEQCVDFYTRVLGLKLHQSGSRRRQGQMEPESAQQGQPSQSNAELAAGAIPAIAVKPGKGALFKINHRRIALLQKTAVRRSSAKAVTASVLRGGEMYFMARFPLKDICERLQELPDGIGGRFVQHTGTTQQLRILKLCDPDGNQLQLVELG